VRSYQAHKLKMIIRATNKTLKISGIKPVIFEDSRADFFPGEWYANSIKTGRSGKLVTLFFHNHAKISIICPTKSLNIAVKQLPVRAKNYLARHGFDTLSEKFDLDSKPFIFKTSSRSTLAFMNQISANIGWHLSKADALINFDFDKLEDIHADFLFSIPGNAGKYETPIEILKRYAP